MAPWDSGPRGSQIDQEASQHLDSPTGTEVMMAGAGQQT